MCFQQVPDRAEARPGKWGGVGLLFQSALSQESTLAALEVWIFMTLFYRAVSFVAVGCWFESIEWPACVVPVQMAHSTGSLGAG